MNMLDAQNTLMSYCSNLQCAHEAQCSRDSVADLAHTVPSGSPANRRFVSSHSPWPNPKDTTVVCGDALFSTL